MSPASEGPVGIPQVLPGIELVVISFIVYF